MSTAELVRKPIVFEEPTSEDSVRELRRLSKKSESELGYSHLTTHTAAVVAQRKKTLQRRTLQEALSSLQIEPFSDESIEKYTSEALQEKQGIWANHLGRAKLVSRVGIAVSIILVLSVVVAIIGFLGFVLFDCKATFAKFAFAWVAIYSVPACYFLAYSKKAEEALQWRWRSFWLKDYTHPIPEFVLRKALQIKEACPTATFQVIELCKMSDVRESRQIDDPFLAVVDEHGQRFYVEVWNEPKFEQQL